MHGPMNIIRYATNASKLERVQRQFAALYFTHFLSHFPYNYACAFELLKLNTLHKVTYFT